MVVYITRPLIEIINMVNWRSLRSKISDSELQYQHYTTSTRLHIARRHFDKLSKMIPTKKITDLMRVEFDEQNNIISEFPPPRKIGDYLSEIDAFFYSLRSCIDSFLWEINLIFNLGFSRVYFRKIKRSMNEKHKGKKITKLLNDLKNESWFKYLNDIRNYLTHRKLSELATSEDLKLYLPSNPKSGSYALEKEFEVLPCIENLLENAKEFFEKGYSLLIDDLR